MTGFIGKLFGSKSQPEIDIDIEIKSESEKNSATPITPSRNGGAFFLEADEAKTLGDLEYMRSAKSIRRTFPKAKLGEENESIRSISAMEMASLGITPTEPSLSAQPTAPSTNGSTNGRKPVEPSEIVAERRTSDSSMDLFRNMARDIKKR